MTPLEIESRLKTIQLALTQVRKQLLDITWPDQLDLLLEVHGDLRDSQSRIKELIGYAEEAQYNLTKNHD